MNVRWNHFYNLQNGILHTYCMDRTVKSSFLEQQFRINSTTLLKHLKIQEKNDTIFLIGKLL